MTDPRPLDRHSLRDNTSQDLVDLYIANAPLHGQFADRRRLFEAVEAAYELEERGYIEQAGTWKHTVQPPLRPSIET